MCREAKGVSAFDVLMLIDLTFSSFYNNAVQKVKLSKIHITVPQQHYCVLTGEIKILYNNYKNHGVKRVL